MAMLQGIFNSMILLHEAPPFDLLRIEPHIESSRA